MVIQTEPIVWPGRPYPLGANWDGEGVNFALFSEHAEAVELCLFDQAGRRELHRVRIKDQTDQVWHCYLPEARPGLLYGYRVHGPYDPNKGHRFNPHKLLLDAYAKQIVGDNEQMVVVDQNHPGAQHSKTFYSVTDTAARRFAWVTTGGKDRAT